MGILSFDAEYYLDANPDVNGAILAGTFVPLPEATVAENAEYHYINFGQGEQRSPNAQFDEVFYLQQNPDVAGAVEAGIFASGFDHFVNFGANEQRLPSEAFGNFNEQAYLDANPDVGAAVADGIFESGFQHWLLFGSAEDREAPGVVITPEPIDPTPPEVDGQIFTLTEGADFVDGTENNDLIRGIVDVSDGVDSSTFNTADSIDGAGGTDRLSVRIIEADGGVVRSPDIENVELIFLRNQDAANTFRLDAESTIGAEQLWSDRSRGDLEITNVTELAAVGMTGRHGDATGGNTFTVQFDEEATEANDTLNVVLNNVRGRDGNFGTLSVAGFATFVVTAAGANANRLEAIQGDDLESLTIVGDQALTVNSALDGAVTSVDASGAGGNQTLTLTNLDLTGAESEAFIRGGAGDDTINLGDVLSDVDADSNIVINGGAGQNTLGLTAGIDAEVAGSIFNFQVAALSDGSSFDLQGVGFAEVRVDTGVNTTISNLASGAAITVTGEGANNLTIDNSSADFADLTGLTVRADGEQEIGALAVNNADSESLASLTLNAAGADDALTVGSFTTRDGSVDPEAPDITTASARLGATGDGDVTVDALDTGDGIGRVVLTNSGEGDLGVGTLTLDSVAINATRVALDGTGDIALDTLAVDGGVSEPVIITSRGTGDRSIEDIDQGGADDVRVRGTEDLTLGGFDEDGLPQGFVGLDDGTTLDASTFEGNLIAALDRADGDQAVTVEVGAGDDQFWLADARTGDDDTEFTFEFASTTVGDVVVNNFATEGANDDKFDFGNIFAGVEDFQYRQIEETDNFGLFDTTGEEDALLVSFENAEIDFAGEEGVQAVVASSGGFDGSITLAGLQANQLDNDNFLVA